MAFSAEEITFDSKLPDENWSIIRKQVNIFPFVCLHYNWHYTGALVKFDNRHRTNVAYHKVASRSTSLLVEFLN